MLNNTVHERPLYVPYALGTKKCRLCRMGEESLYTILHKRTYLYIYTKTIYKIYVGMFKDSA